MLIVCIHIHVHVFNKQKNRMVVSTVHHVQITKIQILKIYVTYLKPRHAYLRRQLLLFFLSPSLRDPRKYQKWTKRPRGMCNWTIDTLKVRPETLSTGINSIAPFLRNQISQRAVMMTFKETTTKATQRWTNLNLMWVTFVFDSYETIPLGSSFQRTTPCHPDELSFLYRDLLRRRDDPKLHLGTTSRTLHRLRTRAQELVYTEEQPNQHQKT